MLKASEPIFVYVNTHIINKITSLRVDLHKERVMGD
jgi:hypothetical protein